MVAFYRRLAPAVFMLALACQVEAQPDAAQPGQSPQPVPQQPQDGRGSSGWRRGPELWWRERSPISKELGLSKEQAEKIEKVFQDVRPDANKIAETLRHREAILSELIKDDSPEAMIAQQVDQVESTRGALNKARQMMLYRMRQVLTAPQRVKFEVLHAQFRQELLLAEQERQKQAAQERRPKESQKPDQKPPLDQSGGRPGV